MPGASLMRRCDRLIHSVNPFICSFDDYGDDHGGRDATRPRPRFLHTPAVGRPGRPAPPKEPYSKSGAGRRVREPAAVGRSGRPAPPEEPYPKSGAGRAKRSSLSAKVAPCRAAVISLPTARCQLPTANCPLLPANCPLTAAAARIPVRGSVKPAQYRRRRPD